MFRKILIAAVLSLGFLAPFAMPAVTEAHDVVVHRHYEYRVYFRDCARDHWRYAGTYRFRSDAEREAHMLRHRGFEVVIR